MKTFYISSLILSIAISLHAQQAVPQPSLPPLPPGPLLKRAPNFSTWRVTYQGHPTEEPSKTETHGEAHSKDAKEKEPVTMATTIIKTGSTILEQNVDASGQRHQIWHFSGLRIVAGISNPVVCPDYGGADIFSTNFASSDFAGLDWLSPTTYSEVVKYQGNDCIVFRGSVSPLGQKAQSDERAFIDGARALGQQVPDALRVPAVAYIDLETRLPVFVQFGNEKRFYQYGTPPTTPLAFPPELAGPAQEYVQHIKRLSAPAARAY